MDRKQFGAGALAVTLTSVALGAGHRVCAGSEQVIGCRHDGHIHSHEPEGPIRQLRAEMTGDGTSTATAQVDANLSFFFDDDAYPLPTPLRAEVHRLGAWSDLANE